MLHKPRFKGSGN